MEGEHLLIKVDYKHPLGDDGNKTYNYADVCLFSAFFLNYGPSIFVLCSLVKITGCLVLHLTELQLTVVSFNIYFSALIVFFTIFVIFFSFQIRSSLIPLELWQCHKM